MTSGQSDRFLGVLGGMGPIAGSYFFGRLATLTNAKQDKDHVPTILWSDPTIPSRPDAYFKGGEDPFPLMQRGIERLVSVGAKAIVIPCNTAHLWFEKLQDSCSVPILHIVEAVEDQLDEHHIHKGKTLGLMGTQATLASRLYQDRLEARGFRCIVPTDNEMESDCLPAISLVKENQLPGASVAAARQIKKLHDRGANAIVLGCTELPLAVPHDTRLSLGILVLDSVDTLAYRALEWWRAPR